MSDGYEALVPLRDAGDRTPLYCVHAVSGSPYAYAGLTRLLDEDQPVYGFEAPGFADGRTPRDSLVALATEYTEELLATRPDEPYQLLGWSMGGCIALDMAHQLLAAGASVPQLIIVDATLPWVAPLPGTKILVHKYLQDLAGIAGITATEVAAVIDPLPEDMTPAGLLELVEKAGIFPEELDAEVLLDRYTIFRAHIAALYGYEITRSYPGPLTVINGDGSPAEFMRWERVATDVTEYLLPGDHYSIWNGESLVEMSRIVQSRLLGADG